MILILLLCCLSSFLFNSYAQASQRYVAPLSIDVSECYVPVQVQSPNCKISRKLALSPVHYKIKQKKQKELVESEKNRTELIADWQKQMHCRQKMTKICCCSYFIEFLCSRNT